MAEQSLYKKSYARLGRMKEQRRLVEPMRRDVQALLRPELGRWDDDDNTFSGAKPSQLIFSGVPQEALEICTDGMQSYIASESEEWFDYSMSVGELNDIPQIRKWLQHRVEVTRRLYSNSNYYSSLNPALKDGFSFGDAATWMESNKRRDGIVCQNLQPRNVWVQQNAYSIINGMVYGGFELPAMEAASIFGKDKLGKKLQGDLTKDPTKKYKFSHFVFERDDLIFEDEKSTPDRDWVDYYCQDGLPEDEQEVLNLSGYFSKPFTFWRHQLINGLPYGWGLGCSAIYSVFSMNEIAKQLMVSGNLAIDPAFFVPTGMKNRVDIAPRGRTYGSSLADKPEILYDGGKYPFGADLHDRIKEEVERWFNVPDFEMLRRLDRQVTAYEIAERMNEKGVLLGPKTGRLQTDKLGQDHNRAFDLANQMELADPPPPILYQKLEELQQKYPNRTDLDRINVEYNGLLAKAQKLAGENRKLEMFRNGISVFAQLDQATLDNFNLDKSSVRYSRKIGWPEDEIRTDEEKAVIRDERQKIIEQQRQTELELAIADRVPKMQKKTEEGSPLEALAGAGK